MWGCLGTFRDVSGCLGVFRVAAIVRLGTFRGLSGLRRNLLRCFLCDSAVLVRNQLKTPPFCLGRVAGARQFALPVCRQWQAGWQSELKWQTGGRDTIIS